LDKENVEMGWWRIECKGGDQGKGRGDGIQYQRGMKSLSRKMQN